jgi:hypothetical protein
VVTPTNHYYKDNGQDNYNGSERATNDPQTLPTLSLGRVTGRGWWQRCIRAFHHGYHYFTTILVRRYLFLIRHDENPFRENVSFSRYRVPWKGLKALGEV